MLQFLQSKHPLMHSAVWQMCFYAKHWRTLPCMCRENYDCSQNIAVYLWEVIVRGGSRYGPIRPRPPTLLTTKSCKVSLFWGHISQFSLNFDTRPPLFCKSSVWPWLCSHNDMQRCACTQGNCATEGNSGNCQSGNCHSGERWMMKPSVHGGKWKSNEGIDNTANGPVNNISFFML